MTESFMNKFLDMSNEMWSDCRSKNGEIIIDLRRENKTLKLDLCKVQQDLENNKTDAQQLGNLLAERDHLYSEMNVYRDTNKDLANKSEVLQAENEKLKKDNQKLTKEMSVLKRKLEEFSDYEAKILSENCQLTENLDKQTSISIQLRKERDNQETKNTRLCRGLRTILSEFDDSHARVDNERLNTNNTKRKADEISSQSFPKRMVKSTKYDDVSDTEEVGNDDEGDYDDVDDEGDDGNNQGDYIDGGEGNYEDNDEGNHEEGNHEDNTSDLEFMGFEPAISKQ